MKALQLLALVVIVMFVLVSPVMAQTTPANSVTLAGAGLGAGLGAAMTIIGAGYGFSKIGSSALESMARQPEVAGRIQTAMIVIAALLEGVTLFALIVCIVLVNKATF